MLFGFDEDAALDFVRISYNYLSESMSKIKGGNDRLPCASAAKLSDQENYLTGKTGGAN
jgi:hypothetical protein